MTRPLNGLLDVLADQCPLCGVKPAGIHLNGPDEIIFDGCGHVVDAQDWLDEQRQDSDEVNL